MSLMMMTSNELLFKSKASGWLERWATLEHAARAYLLIANCFLALKASTNIISYVIDSKSLIIEYNATLLFNGLLRQCLIIMNMLLFGSSLLCLLALMLTLKHNTVKRRLIDCFTFSQILLTIITMLMMAHLWVTPVKVHLAKELPEWREQIARYSYRFKPDRRGCLPDGTCHWTDTQTSERVAAPLQSLERNGYAFQFDASSRRAPKSVDHEEGGGSSGPDASLATDYENMPGDLYRYSSELDRVQQALGCCGIEAPSEWSALNRQLGLLAPSCCRKPLAMNFTVASEVSRRLASQNSLSDPNRNPQLTLTDIIRASLLKHDSDDNNDKPSARRLREHDDTTMSATGRDDLSNTIFYCPRDENVTRSGLLRRRLTRDELLELQLAIEWTNESPRALLHQHRIVSGCQRAIDERDSRCLFAMRLSLLALVTLLFFNIVAKSAAFESTAAATARAIRRASRKDSAISSLSVVSWPDWQQQQLRRQEQRQRTHLALNINNYNLSNSPIVPYNPLGDELGRQRAAARVYAAEGQPGPRTEAKHSAGQWRPRDT